MKTKEQFLKQLREQFPTHPISTDDQDRYAEAVELALALDDYYAELVTITEAYEDANAGAA